MSGGFTCMSDSECNVKKISSEQEQSVDLPHESIMLHDMVFTLPDSCSS